MDNDTPEREFGEIEAPHTGEESEDTTDEQVETTTEDDQEDESEQTDNQDSEEGDEDKKSEDESQQPKLTEKGTKEDPNPESAVHQNLANERRVRGQMETVLADPKLIAKFVKSQYGIEMPIPGTSTEESKGEVKETIPTKKWTAKDFENIEDVADKFNQLQESFSQIQSDKDKKIETLQKQVDGVLTTGRMTRIADSTTSDVKSLRTEPELNPSSPDFIPGLERQIALSYKQLDFDKESGTFKGQFSMKEIGEQFIAIAREARKAGVKKGQTIIRDKTGSKVRTSQGVRDTVDTDNMSPAASISQGIAKMFK